jgi:hypothetical protein
MGQGQVQQQQIQAGGLENQSRQMDLDSKRALQKAYMDANGDPDKTTQLAAKYGAQPQALLQWQSSVLDQKMKTLDLVSKQGDIAKVQADAMQGAHDAVSQADPASKPIVYQQQLMGLKQRGIDVSQLPPQYPGDQQFALMGATVKTHSQMVDEALKNSEVQKNTAQAGAAVASQGKENADTAKTNAEMQFYKQNGGAPGVSPEQMQMSDWMKKNPGKGPADFLKYKASIPITMQQSLLTPQATAMAGQMYQQTGQLPTGMRSPGMSAGILNQAAAAPGGVPNIAGNKMAYAADTHSLDSLQKNFDQVTAFENTAGKNLDVFLNTAKKVVDSGSPLVNTPLRNISSKVAGSENMAAFNAARVTALTEISKVLNSSNASGVLSDSARSEVAGLIGPNATLKQVYSAANILKQDMANRHQAYVDQISAIKQRGGGQQAAPAQHVAGGTANGLTEGQTGTGSDGKKYVVKNGTWQPQ